MSARGSGGLAVTLPWGDQDRTFRLRIGEWRKIEAKCGEGPEEIAARLAPSVQAIAGGMGVLQAAQRGLLGRWRTDDVREVILQGLIAGDPSLGPVAAAQLVRDWVDERPLRENVLTAFAIVMASLEGMPEDDKEDPAKAGELDGEDASPGASPAAEQTGAQFTAEAPAPDLPPSPSME